ncbi:MAG: heme ABC transporter ATP-binding protein [Treponema sp. GWB1_62_6]|nr:MAG: heme ABC transporter ATP-binding protein [Treponema sp. GWA1_62_8]OHE64346.1 MAG: heme ABC transporter ATP-binding protein [Treponema sp. GWC1_61_84]OHE67559.1 MAG: heme ABC transporter ATP-binding protein [Treponema sp. GWB1_62_6]HCM27261.1 heme ABC transporter ATP-binding protein [Treponema sp.]
MAYIIEMLDIVKTFPGIRANDGVTLQVEAGAIHALLGENGAGKSTLMSILFGLYQPDSGVMRIRGKEERIVDPNTANRLGIGMVHQHFKLVHNFTVTENIVLGLEPRRGPVLDMAVAEARVAEISRKYGLEVDPREKIENIGVGMQQRVEILKMLYRDAEILIFDEPTAVLTPQEIHELMEIMRRLVQEGKTIVLITHKLKEIKAVADVCTVLRRGKLVGTVPVAGTSEARMAEMMVGREVSFSVEKGPAKLGETLLTIEGLRVKNSKGVLGVRDLSLHVRSGEILGLCGIDGNGQTELVHALTGLAKIEGGRVLLGGEDIARFGVKRRTDAGLGHIPEDRHRHGLVLDFRLDENLVVHAYGETPFSRWGVLDYVAIRKNAERLIEEFDVRSGEGPATPARSLSGGNQQKAIVAREIDRSPRVLVVAQPTRGLDVGAIEYIHKRLVEERDKGKAILLVSLELDEIMDLSDRIAVIFNGEIVGEVDAAATDENELGLMMAGSTRKAVRHHGE